MEKFQYKNASICEWALVWFVYQIGEGETKEEGVRKREGVGKRKASKRCKRKGRGSSVGQGKEG